MNHTAQNGLKASALLLGISVEELIDALNNASKVKEIRTTSGFPLSLPTRPSQTQQAPEVCSADDKGCRTDSDFFKEPDYSNALECERAVKRLMHSLDYWEIEANYWHGMWLNLLKSESK